MYHTKVYLINP